MAEFLFDDVALWDLFVMQPGFARSSIFLDLGVLVPVDGFYFDSRNTAGIGDVTLSFETC